MDVIKFSYNWNNKLSGKAFTTLRLKNCQKYQIGKTYEIHLKCGKDGYRFFCYALIVDIKDYFINDINDYVAYIDTGYSSEECRQMMRTMYKNVVKDWSKQLISFILLVKEEKKISIPAYRKLYLEPEIT